MGIEDWPEWQKAYRFGVVLIFPPEPVLSLVNGLRQTYDPRSHACCDAHISLTVPAPRRLTEDVRRELETVASRWAPIPIRYGPPMVYPSHPGVTLQVEPRENLRQLVLELEDTAAFHGASPRRWPFSPHMTIAEFIGWEESGQIMETLSHRDLTGEFTCSHLSVAIPDDDFRFTERHRLLLGGAVE